MGHLTKWQSFLIFLKWITTIYLTMDLPTANSRPNKVDVVKYLERYGYLKHQPSKGMINVNEVMGALKSFQEFSGTHVTGTVDYETRHKMKKSRCGMMDIERNIKTHERRKRFVLQGSRWFKHKITWRITKSLPGVPVWKVRNVIRKAFAEWSSAADLVFIERYSGSADIMLRFAKRSHGDTLPFDGRGGVLAHAYYPHNNRGISGDIHFDAEDRFSLDSNRGRSLYWVALHEIGHSLGLDHSKNKESVMYPWYRRGRQGNNAKLPVDDVNGIQAIYGKPWRDSINHKDITIPKSIQPEKMQSIGACVEQISAVWMDHRQYTYFAKGKMLYILDEDLSPISEPVSVSQFFPGVKKIDAVFVNSRKEIVVFENNRYFIFTETSVVQGPRPLTDLGLPSSIRYIDAAFTWHEMGKIYLFTGHTYWRYDQKTKSVDLSYPKSISNNWKGIPRHLDGAFQWKDDNIYFFKGSQYYQLNKDFAGVEKGFPKPMTNFWFKCAATMNVYSPKDDDIYERSGSSTVNPYRLFYVVFITIVYSII